MNQYIQYSYLTNLQKTNIFDIHIRWNFPLRIPIRSKIWYSCYTDLACYDLICSDLSCPALTCPYLNCPDFFGPGTSQTPSKQLPDTYQTPWHLIDTIDTPNAFTRHPSYTKQISYNQTCIYDVLWQFSKMDYIVVQDGQIQLSKRRQDSCQRYLKI